MGPPAVIFNYQAWVGRYPEFANISQTMAQAYFAEATLYLSNQGWIAALPAAPTLFNMLTAHIAWLYAPRDANGNPSSTGSIAPKMVGRVSSAAEGSVNISTELTQGDSPALSFFSQSPYGLSYWEATRRFRTARYIARPTLVGGPLYPFGPSSYPFGPRRGY